MQYLIRKNYEKYMLCKPSHEHNGFYEQGRQYTARGLESFLKGEKKKENMIKIIYESDDISQEISSLVDNILDAQPIHR